MAIVARTLRNYQVEITAGKHTFLSDEPLGIGDDMGANPFDLLLSSLASCTIITLHMYAKRKDWPLEAVEAAVDIQSGIIPNPDGTFPACSDGHCSNINIVLTFHGPLTAVQIRRLEEIAGRCPVHRVLKGEIHISSTVTNLQPH